MTSSVISGWLTSWFDPQDPDLRRLRYDQLMHVIGTGKSALATSLATVLAVAAIAAIWHDIGRVLAFVASGVVFSVLAQVFYLRAEALAVGPDSYRSCNAAYMAHAFFTVAAMAVAGLLWIPGDLAPDIFVLLVLVVCATVRVAHQAAHLPAAGLGAVYFAIAIGLCASEGTVLHTLIVVLGLVVVAMLADLTVRMYRTVESMLKLRQSERALLADQQRLVKELRDAGMAKTHFMARMSHELRTPLNAVLGFSELMLQQSKGPLGAPAYLDYLRYINTSGAHLLELINDILDLSKMESGRYELRETEVDPWETVEEANAMLRLRADEGGVTLVNDVPRGIHLKADGLGLRQIAINLASNAIKFTPPGGRVRWHGGVDAAGRLVLHVEDTGCGIPAADLEVIFEPFGQSSSGYEAPERGTGLGLPIVRSLMELHGGTAEIRSELGEGTTVTVTFPVSRVRPSAGAKAA
jgi:two-component system cell cycle sensor histidine kinase PleC